MAGLMPLAFVFSFICVLLCLLIGRQAAILAIAMFGYGWLLLIVGAGLLNWRCD
jgi:hypothetical protein